MEKSKLQATIETISASENFAVGNDLVHLPAFQASLNDGFKKKVYTPLEEEYCLRFADPLLRYASTWAAKEAVYKAIKQLDDTPTGWKKIEIIREKTGGRPTAVIAGRENKFEISLSLSHDGDYVWAVAFVKPQPLLY